MNIPYDLHIHTCLSPCGDDSMTPVNIANMSYLKGLAIIAITDHNSARNVRAVIEAAADLPLTVIPGLELNTSEEIHVVCLFPDALSAEKAGVFVESCLPPVLNKPKIYGNQLVMDKSENILGEVDRLLITASTISIDDVGAFAVEYGGICFPAHIDRNSNSIIEVLGTVPDYLGFKVVEISDPDAFISSASGASLLDTSYKFNASVDYSASGSSSAPGTSGIAAASAASLSGRYHILTNSDAHYLQDIAEAERVLELPSTAFDDIRSFFTF